MDKPLSVKINGLKDRLDLLIDHTRYDDALLLICQEVNQLVISKNLRGKGLYLPEVDSYITKIIDRAKVLITVDKRNDSFSDKTVIMATELYESGGHTGIIESIIKTDPSKYIICLTDLFSRCQFGGYGIPVKIQQNSSSIILTPPGTVLEKINFLANFLNSKNPKAIFHFGHHQDCIGYAAVELANQNNKSVIFHHCDHDPSIGATLEHAAHCDFTPEVSSYCKAFHENMLLFPLVSPKPSTTRSSNLDMEICFASSGAANKFDGNIDGIRYADIILKLLTHFPCSRMLHIGPLEKVMIDEIHSAIEGVSGVKERFFNIGQVPSVSEALLRNSATIYLSSFPLAGGRATSEAQSIGLPVLFFDKGNEKPLESWNSIFANKMLSWNNLDNMIKKIDYCILNYEAMSKIAIGHYQAYSSDEKMIEKLNNIYSLLESKNAHI
jgi:hypothetical protein